MRIVQIIPSFGMGGAETMCAALSRQLLLDGQAMPGGLWRGKETASLGAILATQGAKLQVICLEDGLYQNLSLTVLRLDG